MFFDGLWTFFLSIYFYLNGAQIQKFHIFGRDIEFLFFMQVVSVVLILFF
jgi:hypothetical protein